MQILSLHPRHDANVAVLAKNDYHIIELERVFNERHLDWMHPGIPGLSPSKISQILAEHLRQFFPGGFDAGVVSEAKAPPIEPFNIAHWHHYQHHRAHAAVAFYQSPFPQALVISYDGGGEDGYFRSFLADYQSGITYLDEGLRLNLGSAYAVLAEPILEIKRSTISLFPNAGKMMGLAGYGSPVKKWLPAIRDFYRDVKKSALRIPELPLLGVRLGVDLSGKTLSGQLAADYAATCQQAFEDVLFAAIWPIMRANPLPVCLTGGCALNVIFNEKLSRRADVPVFVPPNPNDCGLALGSMLLHVPPARTINVTYAGLPLLDMELLESHKNKRKIDAVGVAKLLAAGKILGVARGGSEHGPRALGNRSILADPGIMGLKDRLNRRIKFRESFRPYGPITKEDKVTEYFECGRCDMSFMSFNPQVKSSWGHLAAVVHVDGSARVQTVRRDQNPWIYEVLDAFESSQGYALLLNTSFNTKGRPILTTVKEALEVLRNTEIDGVVIEDWLCLR